MTAFGVLPTGCALVLECLLFVYWLWRSKFNNGHALPWVMTLFVSSAALVFLDSALKMFYPMGIGEYHLGAILCKLYVLSFGIICTSIWNIAICTLSGRNVIFIARMLSYLNLVVYMGIGISSQSCYWMPSLSMAPALFFVLITLVARFFKDWDVELTFGIMGVIMVIFVGGFSQYMDMIMNQSFSVKLFCDLTLIVAFLLIFRSTKRLFS